MANDRIYLECKFCGAEQMLWKYYPSSGGYLAEPENLTGFIETHLRDCNPNGYGQHLNGEPGFILKTESIPKEPREPT